MSVTTPTDLPLRTTTPSTWAAVAFADPIELLGDHAHLERAAAANALQLMNRCPDDVPVERWTRSLTSVAEDEVAHLGMVLAELSRRGAPPSRRHRSLYARGLREQVRSGRGRDELVDRLLVSGLIECRSCERFALLADADHELSPLYLGLVASEVGHYRLFVGLAEVVAGAAAVAHRWSELLDVEADVMAAQAPGSTMHSGW